MNKKHQASLGLYGCEEDDTDPNLKSGSNEFKRGYMRGLWGPG